MQIGFLTDDVKGVSMGYPISADIVDFAYLTAIKPL
jgi:hypothetical protein